MKKLAYSSMLQFVVALGRRRRAPSNPNESQSIGLPRGNRRRHRDATASWDARSAHHFPPPASSRAVQACMSVHNGAVQSAGHHRLCKRAGRERAHNDRAMQEVGRALCYSVQAPRALQQVSVPRCQRTSCPAAIRHFLTRRSLVSRRLSTSDDCLCRSVSRSPTMCMKSNMFSQERTFAKCGRPTHSKMRMFVNTAEVRDAASLLVRISFYSRGHIQC